MKAYLECYPCFFKQILQTVREITSDEEQIKEVLAAFGQYIQHIPAEATPPEIGREVYRIISEKTGKADPYRELKKKCTREALALYPYLKEKIGASEDPLFTAARLAIAGNVIDFGVNARFDLNKDLDVHLSQKLAIDHFREFRRTLEQSCRVLYLADNAGETVFDRIFIEEMGKPVVYAVRERPIINDALIQDALDAGLDNVAEIVSSGTDAPGTILPFCSRDFLNVYDSADLIISKGQGNYEGLSDEARPVFFLLKAKCEVIAQDIGVDRGGLILMKAKNFRFSGKKNPTK